MTGVGICELPLLCFIGHVIPNTASRAHEECACQYCNYRIHTAEFYTCNKTTQLFAFHLPSIFQTCTSCLFWFFFCYGFWVTLSKTNLQNFIFMVVVKKIVPRLRLLLSRSPLFVGGLEQNFLPQSFTMRWLYTSFFNNYWYMLLWVMILYM